jgi:hypothetical protein
LGTGTAPARRVHPGGDGEAGRQGKEEEAMTRGDYWIRGATVIFCIIWGAALIAKYGFGANEETVLAVAVATTIAIEGFWFWLLW